MLAGKMEAGSMGGLIDLCMAKTVEKIYIVLGLVHLMLKIEGLE